MTTVAYRYIRGPGMPKWPPKFKADNAHRDCPNGCGKKVGDHDALEFDECMDKAMQDPGKRVEIDTKKPR
jgi:hypothetical protein